jgi:hypothetical protein
MAVQIFQDPADQSFVVVGSALDIRPDQLAQQIRSRCRLFSIKLVFIAPCRDLDLWLRTLASINSYLKPTCELMCVPQAGAVFTARTDLMTTFTKLQTQMKEYNVMMQMMSQVLKSMSDATANMAR